MDATPQPIRLSSQLRQHLRSLRESRGLTQAKLGSLLGVKQARVAEIESDPGAVSVEQLIRILAVLGATLYLNQSGSSMPGRVETQTIPAKPVRQRAISKTKSTQRARQVKAAAPRRPAVASIPKKGTW